MLSYDGLGLGKGGWEIAQFSSRASISKTVSPAGGRDLQSRPVIGPPPALLFIPLIELSPSSDNVTVLVPREYLVIMSLHRGQRSEGTHVAGLPPVL